MQGADYEYTWRSGKARLSSIPAEVASIEIGVVNSQSKDRLEEERNEIEDAARRQESKTKDDAPGGGKPKRRKLAKLVGWGDPQEDMKNPNLGFEVANGQGVGNVAPDTVTNLRQTLGVGFGFINEQALAIVQVSWEPDMDKFSR